MTGPFAPLFLTGLETYFEIGIVMAIGLVIFVAYDSY